MSIDVQVDTSQLDAYMEDLREKLGSFGTMIADYLKSSTIPQLEAEAGSQRKVRTGTYMGTWEAEQDGEDAAVVTTEAYYWKFLEYGTSRGIQPKPVVSDVLSSLGEDLEQYLERALEL